MKKQNLLMGVVGLLITATAVYAYAYVAGKGWKKSQNDKFLNASGGQTSKANKVCVKVNEDGSTTTYTSHGGSRPCPYGGNQLALIKD